MWGCRVGCEAAKEAASKAYNMNSKYKYRIVVHTFHMQVSLSSNAHEKTKETSKFKKLLISKR